jgi:PadR family transcriptional regulator, regulatory protein PadR
LRKTAILYTVIVIMTSPAMGEFELAVLVCIRVLGPDAYGAAIQDAVSTRLGRECSVGAVYTTLQRLERRGFVRSWMSEPTPIRGGRAKRCVAMTAAGDRALQRAQETARRLWSGIRLKPVGP